MNRQTRLELIQLSFNISSSPNPIIWLNLESHCEKEPSLEEKLVISFDIEFVLLYGWIGGGGGGELSWWVDNQLVLITRREQELNERCRVDFFLSLFTSLMKRVRNSLPSFFYFYFLAAFASASSSLRITWISYDQHNQIIKKKNKIKNKQTSQSAKEPWKRMVGTSKIWKLEKQTNKQTKRKKRYTNK